jgi:hypothetical protein
MSVMQECTNPRRQVVRATKLFIIAPNTFASSVWNLRHVSHLTPKILRWFLDFWKTCTRLAQCIHLRYVTVAKQGK